MKSEELRIGNWVSYNLEEYQIDKQDFIDDLFNNGHYLPVQLTEEWLEKFGFEKTGYCNFLFWRTKGDLTLEVEEGYWFIFDNGKGKSEIKYVHQLQNLYYALTGNELIY